MAKRRKKYGWLYHEREGVWMPPDGAYAAEHEGSAWVLYRCGSSYNIESGELLFEDCDSLEQAVDMAERDRAS